MTKPYVIGIAGGSASGKSTFSQRLKDALPGRKVTTFHMDDYYKPDKVRPPIKAPITDRLYQDDNHPNALDLPKLNQDLAAAITSNQWDVVIVEGLFALYDDNICRQLDLKLYVECRPDERIVRRLKRNMAWGLTFDEIADVYLDMVRYRHDEYVEASKWKADLILNGSQFSDKALAMVVQAITKAE